MAEDEAREPLPTLMQWRDTGRVLHELIVEARRSGVSWAQLEEATGLTRKALHSRVVKAYGQLPE